jgi:hypothetical protein
MNQNDSFEQSFGQPVKELGALKGHDYSRAEGVAITTRALAPEVCSSEIETGIRPSSAFSSAPEGGILPDLPLAPSSLGAGLALNENTSQPECVGELELHSEPHESDQFTPVAPPERPLFQSFTQPEVVHPARIPHFGHLCLLAALGGAGLAFSTPLVLVALHFRLFGVTTLDQAKTDVHYTLGSTIALYVVTLALSLYVFPLFWKKSFFVGVQWNVAKAMSIRWRLFIVGCICFLLAMLDEVVLPSPEKAPIEEMFRTPGAAWMMLVFGVTLAPFFEEIAFRGFLLPAFATAWDWAMERGTGKPALPLDEHGYPRWSTFAMVVASFFTSILFAAMHADQQGHALGPFLLLIVISLLLCAVRLRTRSLAASVLVHASYNFLLFSLMFLGTGGFRHLDKM